MTREVFPRINPDISVELLKTMDDELFMQLFGKIDSHLGARLLSRLELKVAQEKLK